MSSAGLLRTLATLVAMCIVLRPTPTVEANSTTITWEERGDIKEAQITSYKVYNKAREVSGVSIPFEFEDDGRTLVATWKPNNY